MNETATPRLVPARRAACALLFLLFVGRAFFSVQQHSVTVDEFVYLPAGIALLQTGDFGFTDLNPPLARALQALPILFAHPKLPENASSRTNPSPWRLGYVFQDSNRARYVQFFSPARFVTVLLGAFGAAVAMGWARAVWGQGAALAALGFLAFEPNWIAHAGLVTTDVPFCTAALLALWTQARARERPSPFRTALAGVVLGAAQLTKFTALLLYPVLLVHILLVARPVGRGLRQLAVVSAISLLVLNAGYCFEGSCEIAPASNTASTLWRTLHDLRVPLCLPRSYVRNLALKSEQTVAGFPTYLNGRVYRGSAPWYYALECLLMKSTLGALGLSVAAAFVGTRALSSKLDNRRRVSILLWITTGLGLVLASSATNLNLGVRYVLLLYPLLALAMGGAWRWAPRLTAALLVVHAFESAAAYPNELAFFNLVGGGPGGGLRYLADSNLDWGQDLPALAKFMRENETGPIQLAYFGRVDPRLYGVEFSLLDPKPHSGWVAISANFLAGLPYPLLDAATGTSRWPAPGEFEAFGKIPAVARVGASIYVYRTPP
ncbi:MAG TPA: glycosyltransferase family 39 protein [Myxococcota bacterium]|nr:glycosyltransferase family 39 protein [Myxococcota bacterium]